MSKPPLRAFPPLTQARPLNLPTILRPMRCKTQESMIKSQHGRSEASNTAVVSASLFDSFPLPPFRRAPNDFPCFLNVGNMALRSRKAMSASVDDPSHLLPFTSVLYFRTDHSVTHLLDFSRPGTGATPAFRFSAKHLQSSPTLFFRGQKKLGVT